MTRAEIIDELVKRTPSASAQDVVMSPVSMNKLLFVLEMLGFLGPPKDTVGLALCQGCNKLTAGWPDGWRWSARHHVYVCIPCATEEKVTP